MIAHVQRWIRSSVAKHFHAIVEEAKVADDNAPFSLFLEGMPNDKTGRVYTGEADNYYPFPGNQKDGTLYEIRVDGPVFQFVQGDTWNLLIHVLTQITVPLGDDLFRIDRECGLLAKGYTRTLSIGQYGDGDDFLACMHLVTDRETIKVTNIGIIELGTTAVRAVISGYYSGDFVLPTL